MNMGAASMMQWPVVALLAVVFAFLFSRIVTKAGFPPLLAILMLIPVANLIFLWWFAFAEWPKFPKQT